MDWDNIILKVLFFTIIILMIMCPLRKLLVEGFDVNALSGTNGQLVEKIMRKNQSYNINEKRVKRILVRLVVDKYLKIEIVKIGKGMYGSWKEQYLPYKKSKKILSGEKKIKI